MDVMNLKKSKINIGIIAAFIIIALFNHCRDVRVNRESKIADEIKINAVEVELEDILTPPKYENSGEFVEELLEDTPKTR